MNARFARRVRRVATGVTALVLPASLARADAASGSPLALTVEQCPDLDAQELGRQVEIELGRRAVRGPTDTLVRCAGGEVLLVVGAATGRRRVLTPHELPADETRPRTLALLLAELATESPTPRPRGAGTGPSSARLASPRPEPAPPPAEEPAATARRQVLRGAILVGGRRHATSGVTALGATASLVHAGGDPLRLELDADVAHGTRTTDLGDVALTTFALAAIASAAARLGDVELSAGAGAFAGLAHVSGSAREADVRARAGAGPWAGPLVVGDVLVPLGARLHVRLRAELGVGLAGTSAATPDGAALTTAGVWAGARAGLGFAF